MKVLLLVFAAVVSGCGAIDSYLDDGDDATTIVYVDPSGDRELATGLLVAINRWEAAGVRAGSIKLVQGGAPAVHADPESGGSAATVMRGHDYVMRLEFKSVSAAAFAHELGCHALLLAGNEAHTESGICSANVKKAEPIDATSLERVCSDVPCDWFAPEN